MLKKITLFCFLIAIKTISFGQLVASFTADKTKGCPPLVVNFTNTSTGPYNTISWDLAGSPSTNNNPSKVFTTSGLYDIVLTISDGVVQDTQKMTIQVFDLPQPDFKSNDTLVCTGQSVCFTNLTTLGAAPLRIRTWDFSDPPTSNVNAPCHTFNTVGSYAISLYVEDTNGCSAIITKNNFITVSTPPTASFTATPSTGCTLPQLVNYTSTSTGNSLTYNWHFGNNTTDNVQNPSTTYSSAGTFKDTLIVTDNAGCTARAINTVTYGNANADFTVSKTLVCANEVVTFTNTSSPIGTAWSWDFGGQGTSTLQSPTKSFATAGVYSVTLITTNGACKDTIVKTNLITVQSAPTVSFTVNDSASCKAPLSVTFTPTPNNLTTYSWTFGTGASPLTSNAVSPTCSYTQAGTFSPSLTVTNAAGCSTTVTRNNLIKIIPPTANFVRDVDSGCVPITISFRDTSISPSAVASYVWIWGDGTPNGSGKYPTHTYTVEGTYTPQLIITTIDGCIDTVDGKIVKVGNKPIVDFIASPLVACLSELVQFTNLSTGGTRYFWDFGDGTDFLENPLHKFIDTGFHDITLTVINNGCRVDSTKKEYVYSPYPKAKIYSQKDCVNPLTIYFRDTSILATSWFWEFGDPSASTSTLENPTFTYPAFGTYKVKLTVSNSTTGCTDSISQNITIGPSIPQFGANKFTGCAPLSVAFSDSSVGAAAWYWDFGNGKTSTAKNPTCVYDTPGIYTVKLVINRNSTCPDSIIKFQYISVRGINPKFIADTIIGCSPFLVNFTNQSTIGNTQLQSWHWYFGDGDSSQLFSPSHTYIKNGQFTVKLTARDTSGCVVSLTKTNYIDTRKPVAIFKGDTLRCIGELDSFINTSTGATSYLWNFGDGGTSTLKNPTHAYANYGRYTVTLKAMNAIGCDSTLVKNLYVRVDSPSVDFSLFALATTTCPPTPFKFKNLTKRKDMKFTWYFGDGGIDSTTASKDSVTHIYFFPGVYTVKLIGVTKFGCIDTATHTVNIGGPLINYTLTPKTGCAPLKVSMNAALTNAATSVFDMGDGTVINNTSIFNYTYNNGGTYVIKAILTDTTSGAPCTVIYNLDTIRVGNTPVPNLPRDTALCLGDSIEIDLGAGTTYTWTILSGDSSSLSCTNCAKPTFFGEDTTTYLIRVTNGSGCDAIDTITFNVEELPILTPLDSIKLCRNEIAILNASGGNLQNATWSPNLYLDDSTKIKPTITATNDIQYTISSKNRLGCVVSKPFLVRIIDAVDMYGFKNDTICIGDTVHLWTEVFDSSYSGVKYHWTPNQYLNNDSSQSIIAKPPTDFTYTITATSATCTPSVQSFFIKVNSAPSLTLSGDQISTPGAPIRLYAQSNAYNGSYEWMPQTTDDISCIYCRVTTFKPRTAQFIIAEITTPDGCKARDTLYLRVFECDPNFIFVPNTFTPNGDGNNEALYVRSEIISKLEYFRVFDRWGNIVFETADKNVGWDGNYGNKEAQSGVYVYSLSAICTNGNNIKKSGNVTLIR